MYDSVMWISFKNKKIQKNLKHENFGLKAVFLKEKSINLIVKATFCTTFSITIQ